MIYTWIEAKPHKGVRNFFYSLFVIYLVAAQFSLFFALAEIPLLIRQPEITIALTAFFPLLFLVTTLRQTNRQKSIIRLATLHTMVLLPIYGMIISINQPDCSVASCSENYMALKYPEIFWFYLLYSLSVISFYLSKKRPEALSPIAEVILNAGLLIGMLSTLVLTLHFQQMVIVGIIIPIALPASMPPLVLIIFMVTAYTRLSCRFHETGRLSTVGISALLSIPLIGLWSILQKAFYHTWPHEIFTQTCEWGFSQLTPPPADCHYLCTIAAQGSPKLVKPLRLGVRGKHTIIVNRQLAVANAFEDLLHERWPSFGHLCRRAYDKLAFPVSRYLCKPMVANTIYIAMKPAEYFFYLSLLLLDKQNPESRINRMYLPECGRNNGSARG